MVAMPYLLKSEPDKYSFDDLLRDGETVWDGISNAQALNFLAGMHKGEKLVIYHSNVGKEVVGTASVVPSTRAIRRSQWCASRPGSGSKSHERWQRCAKQPSFMTRSCSGSSGSRSCRSLMSSTTGCCMVSGLAVAD